ncbi:MAG TPA: hypothetical protein VFQ89_04665, partial [Candidatus Binatia bacterium]|nr:hypothetical protein [Candidatus Binatia bacterium]
MTAKTILAVLATIIFALFTTLAGTPSHAAEVKPAPWQAEWDKTIKAAEEEGAVNIYMTSAFESVFREAFQKKFPKIKVTTVVGRGFQLGQ